MQVLLRIITTCLVLFAATWPLVLHAQQAKTDVNPLLPADTSSPRETLRSFNENMTEAMLAWRNGALIEDYSVPGRRALETFDFSQLAGRGRVTKEVETALFLKEILDRLELPPWDEVPGKDDVERADIPIKVWTIPGTPIVIALIDQGSNAGKFLFTAETVSKLEDYYSQAKTLPYQPGALTNIHSEFMSSPGSLFPRAWVAILPDWSRKLVFGQALWQWMGVALGSGIALYLLRIMLHLGRRWDKKHRETRALARFGHPAAVLASVLLMYGCQIVFVHAFRLSGDLWLIMSSVIWALIYLGLGWFVFLVSDRVAEAINELRQTREGSIDGQLVKTLLRLTSLVLVVIVILHAADFFGVPITPILASLGVGGLAVALAIRPTLENIIGGLTLFADKPVRIGDMCRYGDDYGRVEEIGLRSTRLRRLDDQIVSVPNADFSQRELVNVQLARRRLYRTMLGLRYETSPDQLRFLLAKLREMLNAHPKISPDMLHVRFHGFGAYSLDIEIFAYIRTRDWLNYRAIREDINFRVMNIIEEAGTGFAFPSQTTYLGRDAGLDDELGHEAERQVSEWRAESRLPFPDGDKQTLENQENKLDYPPEGSPDFKGKSG